MEVTVGITLTASERELLLSILEEHQRELLREISRTDRHVYKVGLKENAGAVEAMLRKLRSARPSELATI
jgi:hypothetical protein